MQRFPVISLREIPAEDPKCGRSLTMWLVVVCQNSAERDPKRDRQLAPQPEPPRSAELSPLALDRGRMDWLHRRSSEVGGACKDFPVRRSELPAPAHRELADTAVERHGNFGSVSSRRVRYRRNSRTGASADRKFKLRFPWGHPNYNRLIIMSIEAILTHASLLLSVRS